MGNSKDLHNGNRNNSIYQYPYECLEIILENVAEGIMITDQHLKIIAVNPAFEFVTGYSSDEVIGKTPTLLQSGIHEKDFYIEMWEQIKRTGSWQGEIWNRRKTGDIYPESLTIKEVRDKEGNITNYCGLFTDLSEMKIVENELEKRALTDSLTEVNNRFAFLERMNSLLESSKKINSKMLHAVFFLDLDRFKQVNDTLGHSIGDQLLLVVAKRLKRQLKNKDIIARYGGDEFVITLTNITHPREAAYFAEKIIKIIEEPVYIEEQEIYISTSIGISIYPHDGNNTDELVNRADKAMYYSKQNGRNGFSFYFEDLSSDSKRVLKLDGELRKAIENKDFELYFQPKISLSDNRVVGIEALVRWNNEELGFVSPAEFIPFAEETGLIIPISEIIIHKACEDLRKLRDAGYSDITMSINISSIHFQQVNFLKSIKSILEKNNTSANNFEIEMTERTVMNNDTDTVSKLVRLKQLGFKLSIDDFGTGYSSLSYLVRFPLDYLKIDRSFIQHMVSLDEKQAVVDAIIQMAHRLKMKVVAEGVESVQQLNLLREMGCDFIQGYYYSKPVPMDELIEFLQIWEVVHQEGKEK
ncbi:putative bifunctional diguanylate cyclase/phosphodiesterase [Ureibacillus manganicus]|uniref:Diguanylate cyclase n=1 Tax=Ureibacillus manganicus DSM 26584 TaxID=1384049 RepID=A0A0A3I448_9BACL|nr:GGDEF domain-containing phosphodiesterase [Ureibacillus manganicus]KGR79509.1 diguanylate cyclase [Ureibacillus manganicus DSM 26584]